MLKDYSEMLQNLPYFMHTRTQSCLVWFSFHTSIFFPLNADKLRLRHSSGGKIKYYCTKGEDNFGFSWIPIKQYVSPSHFINHEPLVSEVWPRYNRYWKLLTFVTKLQSCNGAYNGSNLLLLIWQKSIYYRIHPFLPLLPMYLLRVCPEKKVDLYQRIANHKYST